MTLEANTQYPITRPAERDPARRENFQYPTGNSRETGDSIIRDIEARMEPVLMDVYTPS